MVSALWRLSLVKHLSGMVQAKKVTVPSMPLRFSTATRVKSKTAIRQKSRQAPVVIRAVHKLVQHQQLVVVVMGLVSPGRASSIQPSSWRGIQILTKGLITRRLRLNISMQSKRITRVSSVVQTLTAVDL